MYQNDSFYMDEVKQIVLDIKSGDIKPIYFLMGEEPYYIDAIASYIEKHVLAEEEQVYDAKSTLKISRLST